jgi:hypothetical protein
VSEIQTFALGDASPSEPPGCSLWRCQRAVDRLQGDPVNTTIRPAPWIWLIFLAIIPIRLSAEPVRPPEMLREITLDIDQDGKQDRTVLTRNDDESSYVDLTSPSISATIRTSQIFRASRPSQNGIWRAPCL